MGQCEEALGNNEGALSSYKRSLELCSTQNDIVVKVIYLCIKCSIDPLRAKLWADKGSRICPGHPAVFDLKWHLLEKQEPRDFEEMELLLADELARRAREPQLHIKLVKLYMEAGSYKRAFLHCQSVQKTGAFDDNMDWLECACDAFDFHRQSKEDGRISASLVFALTLSKLMKLHLGHSSSRTCTGVLHRFDKTVKEMISLNPHDIFHALTPEWKDCVTEMKGQLYLNTVVYIMKLAQENIISWMKAKRMSVAVLMTCWQIDVPQTTSKLFSREVNYHNIQPYDWSTLACSRLSQTGHLLLYLEDLYEIEWLKNCVADICTHQGHAAMLDNIYPDKVDSVESFLASDPEFEQTEFKIPDLNDLLKYDQVTVSEHAVDLHHIVWLGLHWGILDEKMKPGVGVIIGRLFEGISLDVKNMNNCHHSSLCLRDIEVFTYAIIRSSKNIHLDCNKSGDSLKLPPAIICPSLVTKQQQDWWQAAYGLYTGKFGTLAVSKLKTIMQKGLETIRCMQNHGIDPRILIYVSFAFWEKGLSIESSKKEECDYKDHWQSLQRRAMHYMKEALRILEIFRSNKTIPVVEHPLILPLSEPLQEEEITSLLNKNYLKLAESAMLGGDLLEALKYYKEVKSLQSFYSQAQIYIRLASGSDRKSIEGEKDYLHYIKKAKEKLSICINNSDHSPDFKEALVNELRELEATSGNNTYCAIPKSKKALNFQVDIPDADVGIDDSQIYTSNGEIPKELEKSMLQEQLDAKESEIKSLKQALAMYKAHIDMQKHYQVAQPVSNQQQPLILQPFPPNVQHRHIRSLDSTTSTTATPMVQTEMGTPSVPGGSETPSDMWWDSFSPQPSFEKGYFAGLAKHAEQSREENGEEEAPTLKDPSEPQTDDPSTLVQSTIDGVPAEGLTPKKNSNQSSSPAAVRKESHSPHTPTSPATYEGSDIYVEPIVHLTSKSEIVTGEEEETVKFVHRAKLYRFDKEASQWKERGLGDVKILFNEKNNKSRITMRREQVFRVCCNHFITPAMNLESKIGSKAAWSWYTTADATDEETRPEQFTIKFKSQETADQFKEVFIECQKLLDEENKTSVRPNICSPVVPTPVVNPFLNVTSLPPHVGITTPPQYNEVSTSHAPEAPNYGTQPGGFQFTFGSTNQSNMLGTAFNGFTFQPLLPVQGETTTLPLQPLFTPPVSNPNVVSPSIPVIVSYVPQPVISPNTDFANISNLSDEIPFSALTPTTFSGFSFSNKSPENKPSPTIPCSEVESGSSEDLTTNFPMMASLLKDSASSNVSVTPENTIVIEGMDKLPVFEKGLVDKNINPASFWTTLSPEKPFFTGNSVGLEAIGHKEEPRAAEEDENVIKPNVNTTLNEADPISTYTTYDDYYGQNGEYYGDDYYDSANDDDDDDQDDDWTGQDNQPSRASSSRRGSDDEDNDVLNDDRPVEDRFDIPKKTPNMNIIDVIDNDLVITMERVPSFTQKLKASRFQLPTTFYLYESKVTCTGCRGCIENFDETPTQIEVSIASPPSNSTTSPFGGKENSLEISFSALASLATSNFSTSSSGVFSGAGAQLFSSATNEKDDTNADSQYDPHFDAIIQLRKVDNIQTGDEDDELIFKHRAKLYRFDEKWKERGVGDIKLTKNKTTGYCRVLMRRELIHKVCANHAVMPNMELKPLHTSDASLVWFTPSDYSEGLPPIPQKLCVKFKSKEIADQFAEKFDICKQFMEEVLKAEQEKEMSGSPVQDEPGEDITSSSDKNTEVENIILPSEPSEPSSKLETLVTLVTLGTVESHRDTCDTSNPNQQVMDEYKVRDLRSKFAPKAGSWDCPTCMIQNNADAAKCVACETPNPNEQVIDKSKPAKGFTFGISPSQTLSTTSSILPSSFTFGSATNTPAPFSFGSKTEVSSSTFSFGVKPEVPVSSFTFGGKPETSISSFTFGTKPEVGSAGFSFGPKPNVESPAFNVAWGNEGSKLDSTDSQAQSKEKVGPSKFDADPDTWECPSCLAKNNGCREVCRSCNVPKEKTPVVTLDPAQFSVPINQQITTRNSETLPPMQLKFDSCKLNTSSPFSSDSGTMKQDIMSTNKERDKELMPPPKGLPITKVSPKQDDKKGLVKEATKADSTSSWVPQGLNLNNLFSFGTTPSPSLSNASSVDDLSQACTISNVPAAFSGTSFTFKFEPPLQPKTPEKESEVKCAEKPVSPNSPNEYYDEEEGNNSFEFSPLVSVVQVKHNSGEEEEVSMFSARSKMFRFDAQWKERGIGEIKILRHTATNQYRLIMRRDQTHKLCANHGLLSGMSIKPMQGAKKAYVWKTFADISDGEAKEQLFAARFKDEGSSDDFREMFQKACSGEEIQSTPDSKDVHNVIEIFDSDEEEEVATPQIKEVSLGYEASITEELKEKAKEFLLPSSFYHVPTIGCTTQEFATDRVGNDRSSEIPAERHETKDEDAVAVKLSGERKENEEVSAAVKISSESEGDEEKTPQLTLTHEKVPDVSMESRSDKMLLPKGFYNYKESANLTDENVEVITDDTNVNLDEIYSTETEYSPFQLDESFKIVFDEPCSVFRVSTTMNDYVKLNDGSLKVKEEEACKGRHIILVRDDKIYLCIEITANTVLVPRSDSKNTYDIEAKNIAQTKVNVIEKFALKFQDLLTCERFTSIIDKSKDCINSVKPRVTTDLPAFGSRLFGNSTSGVSFASVITSENQDFQDNTGHTFQGAGATLFRSGEQCVRDETKDPSTEECNFYVEPLVQLESVEMSSGEEKEWLCFNQRCKLYIFDNTTKKWKERGVGDIKLLRHKEKGNSRVVMRRDQVRKLCANHMLLPTTKLEPFKSKELTVTWNAIGDVSSDGPPENCILAARFKNETILEEFKWKFCALAKGEAVDAITNGETTSAAVCELQGSCDPALTKHLSQVKL